MNRHRLALSGDIEKRAWSKLGIGRAQTPKRRRLQDAPADGGHRPYEAMRDGVVVSPHRMRKAAR